MTGISRSAAARRAPFRAGVLTTLVLLVIAACNAVAGEAPQKPAPSSAPAVIEVMDPAPALRVTIDPATGQMRIPSPSAPVLEPLYSGLRMPTGPLPVARLEDGSLMVDLTGIYLTNVVVSIGWDGRPTMSCLDFGLDPQEFVRWLPLTAPPARAKAKE